MALDWALLEGVRPRSTYGLSWVESRPSSVVVRVERPQIVREKAMDKWEENVGCWRNGRFHEIVIIEQTTISRSKGTVFTETLHCLF